MQFLRRKWAREQGYRLRKYLWTYGDNRIAVCFEYEYHDDRCESWAVLQSVTLSHLARIVKYARPIRWLQTAARLLEES